MLLGNKRARAHEQNWCVVLNPIEGEIEKSRVAQKISRAFSLSTEESLDLVNNTPIIVLDNLTREVATQVKEFFSQDGARMSLTNDILQKRKYYRTVWPEPPSLAFLHEQKMVHDTHLDDHKALAPEDALNEIRYAEDTKTNSYDSEVVPFLQTPNESVELEDDQLALSRQECAELREEVKSLERQIETLELQRVASDSKAVESTISDEELKQLQKKLVNASEQYESLKQEYQDARILFEEKLSRIMEENKQHKSKLEDAQNRLQAIEKEKGALEGGAAQRNMTQEKMKEEYENAIRLLQIQVAQLTQNLESIQGQDTYEKQKLQMLESEKARFERAIHEQSAEVREWREKYEVVHDDFNHMKLAYEELQTWKLQTEAKKQDFERNQLLMMRDLESRAKEAQAWEVRCLDFEKRVAELQQSYETREKIFAASFKQIQSREEEIELLKSKTKMLEAKLQEKESFGRQNVLKDQIKLREDQLKALVEKQKKMEEEISAKEDSMRQILLEQEAIERALLEDREAQMHLWSKTHLPPGSTTSH